MVVYVATRSSLNTLNKLLSYWAKGLGEILRPMAYEDFLLAEHLPKATYILSDHERLTPVQKEMAIGKWDALAPHCRLLNDPRTVKLRYELLRGLHESGSNRFRVFRITKLPDHINFPVFIRLENDHEGSRTVLLRTREELEREIVRLLAVGMPSEELLVTEHLESRLPNGLYRKMAAFRVGDRIIPRHVVYSDKWVVKVPGVWNAERREEEKQFLHENPHTEELLRIFQFAGIEYGRIDYDVIDGKVQVWEINTNPTVMSSRKEVPFARRASQFEFAGRLADAIAAINEEEEGTLDVRSEPPKFIWS